MPYRFDSELAALVEITPHTALDGITASRARAAELILGATREIDMTGVNITDTCVPGPPDGPDVAVRIYTPLIGTRPTAAVLHLRGGGFVAGALGTDHRANIELSRALGAVVISVDYRLAPENPYPAALEDCYAALCWTVARADRLGVDPDRIAVHGTQAGANLAAALALLARDRGGPALRCQCLVFPELDDRRARAATAPPPIPVGGPTPITATVSATATATAPGRVDIPARWDAYLGTNVAGSADVPVYAAPARATDLHGLPPAYVSILDGDRCRDQGVAYADALRVAGVPVRLWSQPAAHVPVLAAAPAGPASTAGARCAGVHGGRRRQRAQSPLATAVSRERDDRVAYLLAALARPTCGVPVPGGQR